MILAGDAARAGHAAPPGPAGPRGRAVPDRRHRAGHRRPPVRRRGRVGRARGARGRHDRRVPSGRAADGRPPGRHRRRGRALRPGPRRAGALPAVRHLARAVRPPRLRAAPARVGGPRGQDHVRRALRPGRRATATERDRPGRPHGAPAAAARLDVGLGTVWAGDAKDGFNGGGMFVRWIRPDAGRRRDRRGAGPVRRPVRPRAGGAVHRGHPVLDPRHRLPRRRGRAPAGRDGEPAPPGASQLLYAGAATYFDPPPPTAR